MTVKSQELPDYLKTASPNANEISITGKWVPIKKGGLFSKKGTKQLAKVWNEIHSGASQDLGIIATEINTAIGQEAILVHHTFKDEKALSNYFSEAATKFQASLTEVAKPDIHLIRGADKELNLKGIVALDGVNTAYGRYLMGYRNQTFTPVDSQKVIEVTAKWTCKTNDPKELEELIYWWQKVGTDAYNIEPGLLRFEMYQVEGESALIIHETFANSDVLKFHLSKGTAEKYKKDIDKVAYPENYFFRGPVAWSIRLYSKFLKLPATYSKKMQQYVSDQGSLSDALD